MRWDVKLHSAGTRAFRPDGLWRRFLGSRDGATAVEFGMVAMPFFGLLFAVFQTAMLFWSTQVLETAVANASRQLYTEQFRNLPENAGLDGSKPADAAKLRQNFKNLLCANVRGLFNCNTMVDIDVQIVSSFGAADFSSPIKDKVYDPSKYQFQMPGRNQIVVVRASMEYPTFAAIGNPSTSLSSGNQLVMATAAFLTEP